MMLFRITLAAAGACALFFANVFFYTGADRNAKQVISHVEIVHTHNEQEHPQGSLPHGKPAAAIGLISQSIQSLNLLQRTELELVLQSHVADGTVEITIETDDALQLHSSLSQWTFSAAGNAQMVMPLEVAAQSNGTHYLHLFINHIDSAGMHTSRAFAVEFNVGVSEEVKLYAKQESIGVDAHPQVVPFTAQEQIF